MLAVVVVLGLFSGGSAQAESRLWRSVSAWQVRSEVGTAACFAVARFREGTRLRIGFEPGGGGAYLALANAKWSPIRDGRDFPMTLIFDDGAEMGLVARVRDLGWSEPYLAQTMPYEELQSGLAGRHGAAVFSHGKKVTHLLFDGVDAAFAELQRCQSAHSPGR